MKDDHDLTLPQLKKRLLSAYADVCTDSWLRAYARANRHKVVEFLEGQFPKQIAGAGENGEHVFQVIHAIRRSPLDDVKIVEGKVIEKLPAGEPDA